MEQTYWLRRKRASAAMARNATNAQARLIHLDLAGRYSVKAAECGGPAGGPPADDGAYYSQLEAGARFLATQADSDGERADHLGMANRYVSLRLRAAPEPSR